LRIVFYISGKLRYRSGKSQPVFISGNLTAGQIKIVQQNYCVDIKRLINFNFSGQQKVRVPQTRQTIPANFSERADIEVLKMLG